MNWRRVIAGLACTILPAQATSAPALDLSPDERRFIAANPVIVTGGEMDWPPLDFVEDGKHTGAARDYLERISTLTGLEFRMVTGLTWSELITSLRRREIDMLPMMYWTEARGREFNLTHPYLSLRHYVFVAGDAQAYRTFEDLYDGRIAVPAGYASAERLVADHPQINLVVVPTTLDAIDAVVTGRADAVIEQLAGISYYTTRLGITGLQPAFAADMDVFEVQMAVRKDWPVLRDILQKALDAIPREESAAIVAHWTGNETIAGNLVPSPISLTAEERQLLADRNGVLTACIDGNRLPIAGHVDGRATGIASDYLDIIESALDVAVSPRALPEWRRVEKNLSSGHCDFVAHAVASVRLRTGMQLTEAYISEPLVLATRHGENFLPTIGHLAGRRVGVVHGYVDTDRLESDHPGVELVAVDSLDEGLAKVAAGDLFGLLDNLAVVNFAIRNRYENRLKVSGEYAGYPAQIGMATATENAQLAAILGKVLATVSRSQRQILHDKWVAATVRERTDYGLLIGVIAAAVVVLAFVLGRTFRQRARHRSEIRSKNAELVRINRMLEQRSREAIHQAMHDPLTGLSNRTKLNEDLGHAVHLCERTSTRVGVLFLDLDRFKYVNDSLGHDIGDELLKIVAGKIRLQLRDTDRLFRLGGDEFVAALEALTGARSPAIVAQRIIAVLSEPVDVDGHAVSIGVSIGIAVAPDDSTDLGKLLKYADSAMYAAKEAGGNTFRFYQHRLSARARRRLEIESALKDAIGNDQLSLVYQPIVDLARRRVVKAEALLRWRHPTIGSVTPDEFIPIAEENRQIVQIGQWVLREVCRDLNRFVADGADIRAICINVSSIELGQPGFADRLASIVAEEGARPDQIAIEITERGVLEKKLGHEAQLAQIRANGHFICVDDFGTGYSSLAYMKQLPLNVIKVDRSFVSSLPDSQDDVEITSAIISLSHSLGYEVVAEGCESLAQYRFLAARGCNYAQGFCFSEPVPAASFAATVTAVEASLDREPAADSNVRALR